MMDYQQLILNDDGPIAVEDRTQKPEKEAGTTEELYQRAGELRRAVTQKMALDPYADRWIFGLYHGLNLNSFERRAAERAAMAIDDMDGYRAAVTAKGIVVVPEGSSPYST